jgi:hypothetical protein
MRIIQTVPAVVGMMFTFIVQEFEPLLHVVTTVSCTKAQPEVVVVVTVSVAEPLGTIPAELLTTTSKVEPLSEVIVAGVV